MAEPKSKRIKIDEKMNAENEFIAIPKSVAFPRKCVEEIHQHLDSECLCGIELSVIKEVLVQCNRSLFKDSTPCSQDESLLYAGMLSRFFEASVKQHSKGFHCSVIANLVAVEAGTEGCVIDNLFLLLASEDTFISYSASTAMTSLILISSKSGSSLILQKLASNIIQSKNLIEISHSLVIFRNIIEWKDNDEHPLEQKDPETPVKCKKIYTAEGKTNFTQHTKVSATKSLESQWPLIIKSLINFINDYSLQLEHLIVSFFSLWGSILSVKANLPIINIKVFHFGLDKLLNLLKSNSSVVIWRRVIDLYNEFLCYGSTLALQDASEESCNIAHLIIGAVKYKNILEDMPWQIKPSASIMESDCSNPDIKSSSEAQTSNFNDSAMKNTAKEIHNNILLHKLILLVFKAVALTVKESKCDSSSDDSSYSSNSDTDLVGTAMIEQNIRETLRKVDKFIKLKIDFHPQASVAEWIVHLFSEQDDWLIESMLCCLDIYTGCQTSRESSQLGKWLNPHETFVMFARAVHFDHDVFLDFLVSNETCFLLYLLRYLKFLKRNWLLFLDQDERTRNQLMTVLIRLRLAIERLVNKKLFPYDITPILRLLDQCEELYEAGG